ncbi:glycosyltransferase [Enterococcus faecalis]
MKEKNHTFIICAYGESPYLKKCIVSCLQQRSVQSGASQVQLYTSTPNQFIKDLCQAFELPMFTCEGGGIGKDWNNALSFVETKYATIVHQDDIYLPDYGQRILEAFDKNDQYNIVFSDYQEIDSQGALRKRNLNLYIKSFGLHVLSLLSFKWYQRRIYAFGNFICCPAVSYNMKRLKDFKFDETLKMTLDWDAWERIMRREGQIKYIAQSLMYHRIHADSETTNNTLDKTREREEQQLFERYWGKFFSKLIMKFYTFNQKSNNI